MLSGARVLCYVNNSVYAPVSSIQFSSATPNTPEHALDADAPYELIPVASSTTATLNLYRLLGGTAAGAGFVPPYLDKVRGKYFTITLKDRKSGVVVLNLGACSVSSQTWSIPSRGLVTGALVVDVLDWHDEILSRRG